jgi:hypothetical protein
VQPLSVEGQIGFDIAASIGSFDLQARHPTHCCRFNIGRVAAIRTIASEQAISLTERTVFRRSFSSRNPRSDAAQLATDWRSEALAKVEVSGSGRHKSRSRSCSSFGSTCARLFGCKRQKVLVARLARGEAAYLAGILASVDFTTAESLSY